MKNKLCCNRTHQAPATNFFAIAALAVFLGILGASPMALAGDAPGWMHSAAGAPVPAHDEKADAVLLYSEKNVTVVSADKMKTTVRRAYRILRPGGREYGELGIPFNSHDKITAIHGWSIPAEGRDYEVKDKDALEVAVPKVEGSELITDVRFKFLRIPAADPGNVVGYEYEEEEQPMVLQDIWSFQAHVPVRESHYSLQLPPGWEFKTLWMNHPEIPPVQNAGTQQWVVSDVKGIRREEEMPPIEAVVGQMVVFFFPSGGAPSNAFTNWQQMGHWYSNLANGRRDASPELKQEVARLTASSPTLLSKMQAIAQFVQHDIRYVAIELLVGGWQPHSAAEVYAHRYGDCKDKATLMSSMLHEIGIESYYVLINTKRGSVGEGSPARAQFNHAILAIRVPDSIQAASLIAVRKNAQQGRLLFFDPTNDLTPFGEISGDLQANYGLLVGPDGGDLVELPMESPSTNAIERTGIFTLDSAGTLHGDVKEMRVGDRAASERWALRTVAQDADRIKPIESLLAGSLPSFHISKATVVNFQLTDQPFGFTYSFSAENYAKTAGDLLLVRPRILGTKTQALMETKEPRQFPVEFRAPVQDTDQFDIAVPAGYVVDDLPPPVDMDYSFASYHSKTQVVGNTLRYTRTFEIKELSVPVSEADDLKKFYRFIATDERNTAVLKAAK
jgi:hypothetical protein